MNERLDPKTAGARRGREGGFTLLEIMIAAFLFQVGLMALASGFMVHNRATNENRVADLQKLASRNITERLRSTTFTSLVSTYGPTGNDTFWCDEEGNIAFTTTPSDAAVSGTITLYTDFATIPDSFANIGDLFTPGTDPAGKLHDELGVLPVRLTLTQGTTVNTVDLLLSKGGF